MKINSGATRVQDGKCVEWTGAGGDYFLAVAVEHEAVIAEYWGTQADVVTWMDTQWPRLPRKFVPMVYTPVKRRAKYDSIDPAPKMKWKTPLVRKQVA